MLSFLNNEGLYKKPCNKQRYKRDDMRYAACVLPGCTAVVGVQLPKSSKRMAETQKNVCCWVFCP